MADTEPVVGAFAQPESTRRRDHLLIAALCLTLYLAGNGRIDLWDRDEAWYAQTAREMLRSGDFTVPRFNTEPRFRKPVLIYWLMAAAYSVFGDNEFGARFFSSVAGTVTCLLTYRLGTRMYGRRVGLAAALMLTVAPFMVAESKLATTDAVLTLTLISAASCLWELHVAGPSWRWALAFWFLIGVAVLTKGPFGPAFLTLAVFAWLLLSRQWSVLRKLRWLPGLAVAAAVSVPWGVAIYFATSGEFYRVALGGEALGHSFSSMNNQTGFPGFHLVTALAGLFPWTLGLPLAFAGVRRWSRENGPGSFLLGWMIGPIIMLELMRTKLPQYYLAAFPAWAIFISRGVVEAYHVGGRFVQSRLGILRVLVLGLGGVGGAAMLAAIASAMHSSSLFRPLLALASVVAVGTAIGLVAFSRRRDQLGWSVTVGAVWLAELIVAAWLLPSANSVRVARSAATALYMAVPDVPIALFGYREPSLVFYLGEPVPTLNSAKQLHAFLDEHGSVLTLLRETELRKLNKKQEVNIQICERIDPQSLPGLRMESAFVARLTKNTAVPVGQAARRASESLAGADGSPDAARPLFDR